MPASIHPTAHRRQRAGAGVRAIVPALLLLTAAVPLLAQPEVDARPNERTTPRDTLARARYGDRIDILSVGVDFVASAGGGAFFDEYRRLGGEQTGLGTYLAPALTGRFALADRLRLTAHVGVHSNGFEETYDVRRGSDPRTPAVAGMEERLTAFTVPLLGGIEFAPIQTQFTSYVGAGLGVAATKVKWLSSVQYTNGGYVRPRENTDEFGITPAGRVYAGVDLRFDRGSVGRTAFRGIFLEASYLFMPLRREYFGAIRSRGEGLDDEPGSDDATLYLGGLSFTFGVNLQVLRR